MPSPLKETYTQLWTGGQNSDVAPELIDNTQYRYMLNCNVLSTSGGNVGIVTNVLGNTEIPVQLPPSGITKGAIGVALDEENNNVYFALWNSDGYHTWYRYNSVSKVVDIVLQSRTDTGDIDIFEWPDRTLILHANVIDGNLLYWTMAGQPARKFNISKAMDKSDSGYGGAILEEWTRAYKRTSVSAPSAEYFTDTDKKFNRLYGYQFQFAVRFHYDDYEKSEVSDWSNVPNPDEEFFTGSRGIPDRNNGIRVIVETGSDLVVAVEILMRKTNPEGGTLPWVSVVTLDKDFHNISSDSNYTYNFYNDGAYVAVPPQYPIRNNSSLPRNPLCQDFTKNSLMYGNFPEGRDQVDIDVEWTVDYQDIFLPDSEENELNSPSLTYIRTNQGVVNTGDGQRRWVEGTFTIGSDVKSGNIFTVTAKSVYNSGAQKEMTFSVTANLTDTSVTIANKLADQMRQSTRFQEPVSSGLGGYVHEVTTDGADNASFDVRIGNRQGWSWWVIPSTMYVNPVNTVTLKDTGQSVRNIKNGSSTKYGLVYRDEDKRKEAVQSNDGMIVPIATMNELGGIKKPTIRFVIKHRPPLWATEYSIVRTDNLVHGSYIYMLIQEAIEVDTGSDSYYDLVVGSLFTYQQLHPNTIITYEFKKGDRVRLAYNYTPTPEPEEPDFTVAPVSKDFEVIDYKEVTDELVRNEITVDGTSTAATVAANSDNIGSYIVINNQERLIVGASNGVSYSLNDTFPVESGSDESYPSFRIVNRRGVLRLKHDPDFPIDDFSIVEVYTPAVGDASANENIFYEFGQRFDIIDWGTTNAYHAGNVQNQTASQDAIVDISNGTSYVRNRELPTNNDPDNPQVLIGIVEDRNYSDFYVSDMTDNGKANGLDQGQGEVLFDERIRWSGNYIEDTRINGLNDFANDARVDYNDKYGAIKRLLFSEDRLYVFKHLKDAWATVYARRITETTDGGIIAASPNILPDMLTYFLWDGGVGNNPESIVRNGNNIYHISTDSGVWIRLGGNGAEPISKTYPMDRDVRELIESSKKAGAFIISWFDRKNDNAEITFEPHDNVTYNSAFSDSGWDTLGDPIPAGTVTVSVISGPSHGSTSVTGTEIEYTPDNGYSGPDEYMYEVLVDGSPIGQRHVCITVQYVEGPKAWRPIDQSCVVADHVRTGYSGWENLEEYDTFNNVPTGNTKPNVVGDPDYVAPVYDATACSPQEEFLLFSTNSTSAAMSFTVESGSTQLIMEARNGDTVLDTTSPSASSSKVLDMSGNAGGAEVYVRGPVGVNSSLLRVISNSNSVTSENIVEFPNVYWMEFRNGLLTELSVNNIDNISLQYIIYEGNSVTSFNPSGFTNLFNLSFGSNGVSSILLNTLPSLEELSGPNNLLSTLPTEDLPVLRVVEMQANQLTSAGIDFSFNSSTLRAVFLAANEALDSYDPSDTPGLVALTLDRTLVTNLDPSVMPGLISLDVTRSALITLDISDNDDITDLRCGECEFTADDALPDVIDAIIIKMDQNITSGGVLHYDTSIPGGVQPSSASLAAYNSLVSKGTEIQGKVPA